MMGDLYQHPVFFECESLEEHLTRLQNYFRIRRKSGGGECGPLTRVDKNVYSVAYRNKKDQQRVLQRSEHVLDLEDRSLVFTVRESLESDTSSHLTTVTSAQAVTFGSVSNDKFTVDVHHEDQAQDSTTMRLVLLGKTGSGKSHLGNTIFGEERFATYASSNSGTIKCQTETKTVSGRSITLIDTPGFFDTGRSEADVNSEIMSCMTECAPGPHAFLIVLRVGRFTEHEQAVITKIVQSFSDEALKYAVVVFTHGDQLHKKLKIEDFVSQNENLSDLVSKCGGRCHVFDNKHWNNNQPDNYRGNQFQVEELLKTIEKMVVEKNGGYYTNKTLQDVETAIQEQIEHIRHSMPDKNPEEIRSQARSKVSNRFLIQIAGIATGALLGAFFGVVTFDELVKNPQLMNVTKMLSTLACVPTAQEPKAVAGVAGLVGAAAVGGVMGGVIGNELAKDAESLSEAVQRTYKAVEGKRKSLTQFM
ncbi:unnamed protein product [Oreochromis niloticus]|nr:unnamed protein product [Mustela putorius furo]